MKPSQCAKQPQLRRSRRLEAKSKQGKEERRMFVSPAQTRSRGRAGSKSPETPSPVQSHSARTGKPSHRSADQDDCYVSPRKQHQSRKTNFLPNFQRHKKQKIKYPTSNDPQWKILDQELIAALTQMTLLQRQGFLPSSTRKEE